jgi:hypothetical protein
MRGAVRKHYLLLAHDQPDHVVRLIRRLDDAESTFWLHVDARVDIEQWSLVTDHPDVVVVGPRVSCVWGTWSMVEAQLAQMRACLAGGEPGYLIMLSGQSYPVKTIAHIDRYLTEHAESVHMDLWALEARWPDNHRDRLDYFCIPMSEDKGDIRLLRPRQQMNARELAGWTRRLLRETDVRRTVEVLRTIGRRRPDVSREVVGGSQWWALPWDVARALMAHAGRHPEYEEFLRWSQFPDETYFQTLLSTLDPEAGSSARPSPTYVDWTEGDWDLPRAMDASDVDDLLHLPEHVLFARKFLTPSSDSARAALDAVLDGGLADGR